MMQVATPTMLQKYLSINLSMTTWNDYRDHSSSIGAHTHTHSHSGLAWFWQVYNIISIFFHFPTYPAVHIYGDFTHKLQPIKDLETEVLYQILSKHTHILLSARWLHRNIMYVPTLFCQTQPASATGHFTSWHQETPFVSVIKGKRPSVEGLERTNWSWLPSDDTVCVSVCAICLSTSLSLF